MRSELSQRALFEDLSQCCNGPTLCDSEAEIGSFAGQALWLFGTYHLNTGSKSYGLTADTMKICCTSALQIPIAQEWAGSTRFWCLTSSGIVGNRIVVSESRSAAISVLQVLRLLEGSISVLPTFILHPGVQPTSSSEPVFA